jgi:hypothetical protein
MEHSPELNELAAALAKAQATFTAVPKGKTAKVGTYSYKYADLADAWDVARKALSDNGLCVVQAPAQIERGVCGVTTMLLHTSGQWMRSTLALDARDTTPQSIGSVITYARRYGLAAMVGLVTDDDTDAQEHRPSDERKTGGTRYEPREQPRQQTTRGEGGIPAAPRAATQAQAKVGSAEEAEAQFYAHYGEEVGGGSWSAVQRYLGHLLPRPTSVEAWREVAKEIVARQRAQKESA